MYVCDTANLQPLVIKSGFKTNVPSWDRHKLFKLDFYLLVSALRIYKLQRYWYIFKFCNISFIKFTNLTRCPIPKIFRGRENNLIFELPLRTILPVDDEKINTKDYQKRELIQGSIEIVTD